MAPSSPKDTPNPPADSSQQEKRPSGSRTEQATPDELMYDIDEDILPTMEGILFDLHEPGRINDRQMDVDYEFADFWDSYDDLKPLIPKVEDARTASGSMSKPEKKSSSRQENPQSSSSGVGSSAGKDKDVVMGGTAATGRVKPAERSRRRRSAVKEPELERISEEGPEADRS